MPKPQIESTHRSPPSPTRTRAASPNASLIAWLLGLMLLFAPLFRAGRPALPLLALELLSAALLVAVLWTPKSCAATGKEWVATGLLLLLPALFLIPLPAEFAALLPGREMYRSTLDLAGVDPASFRPTLSIFPAETQTAWFTLLLPVAVFLGARTLDNDRLLKLTKLLIGIASFQVILGLMQSGQGEGSLLYLGLTQTHFGSAVGTYANRNHLAGLLEMVLPVVLALVFYSVGRKYERKKSGFAGRLVFFASAQGQTAFVFGALGLLLMVGIIFTHSRTGIALAMLGILLTTLVFSRRIGGDNIYGAAGSLVAVAIGAGLIIGLAPVLDRFSVREALEDARWPVFSATADGIRAFFPVGSGPGTYPDVFPIFQPLKYGSLYVNHAHNDYLEWLFEGGVAAALLVLLLLSLYALQWSRLLSNDKWTKFRFLQVGAGIGLFLMLIHTLLDYNLHMPANIIFFAFLAGIFFTKPEAAPARAKKAERQQRRTPRLGESPDALEPAAGFTPAKVPLDQIANPFLD